MSTVPDAPPTERTVDWPRPERRAGWGFSTEAVCNVVPVRSAADVQAAFALARERGITVACWGNGRSYGDAALNDSELLLDFRGMNRILSWDPSTGVAVCEPGVTLQELWQRCLPDGWWPPVVSGTMFTTLGGCAAANVHGKNNWKHGPIGEHIQAFTFVTPDGQTREVTRDSDPDLFHAAIGGFGWLGVFTSVTLQLKQVHSGRLSVTPIACGDLDEMFRAFERCNEAEYDYVVGWIDAFARGSRFGRGQIHAARYVGEGEDPEGRALVRPEDQSLPSRFMGLVPMSWLHRFARPFVNRWGMRLVNWARYQWMAAFDRNQHTHLQEHARFNFLLDFVPDWKRVYEPDGLIQYQLFLPRDRARDVYRRVVELSQEQGLEPWLVVMKRHRADPFWLTHALDGYSFAMDFPVTARNRERLYRLTRRFEALVVEAGGRFYFAKDSVVSGQAVRRAFGDQVLGRFFGLKRRLDPDDLLQSNQFRRIFGDVRDEIPVIDDAVEVATAPEPDAAVADESASPDDTPRGAPEPAPVSEDPA